MIQKIRQHRMDENKNFQRFREIKVNNINEFLTDFDNFDEMEHITSNILLNETVLLDILVCCFKDLYNKPIAYLYTHTCLTILQPNL